jgi:hypothetical protein
METSPAPSLPVCRICLSDQEEDEVNNPLVSPCNCKGSMDLVHLDCLRLWLDSKRETRKTESTLSFQWTIIRCELCHYPYPMALVHKGVTHVLFRFDVPEKDGETAFVVFETIYIQKEVKTIHVVRKCK